MLQNIFKVRFSGSIGNSKKQFNLYLESCKKTKARLFLRVELFMKMG